MEWQQISLGNNVKTVADRMKNTVLSSGLSPPSYCVFICFMWFLFHDEYYLYSVIFMSGSSWTYIYQVLVKHNIDFWHPYHLEIYFLHGEIKYKNTCFIGALKLS